MFKVGDLVRRVRKLQIGEGKEVDWITDHTVPDAVGVVFEVEKPDFPRLYHLEYPECFVKVLWQDTTSALNPLWHWGEELQVIDKIND